MSKPGHTLVDLLDDFIVHMKSLHFSRYTIRQYYYNVLRCLNWLAERFKLERPEHLRPKHMEQWHRHLSSRTTSKGTPLHPRAINKKVENLRGFLGFLAVRGYVSAKLVDAVPYVKEPSVLPSSVLTHEQVKALLDCIDIATTEGYLHRTMLEMLYSSGARVGELLGMDLTSVDYGNGTALVMGKGRKERVVPIGRTALRYLETYVNAVRPYLVTDPSEKALFLDGSGKRFPYHSFRRIVHRYAEKAGIDMVVTPHTFRRSCTTELLRAGAGMSHVKEMLGHETLDTLKHYAKLTIRDLKKTHARCHPREQDAKAQDGGH